MSTEQTAIDQADFDEMSMIAEQHAKKEDDVTCSDVRELEEARARIVELEAHLLRAKQIFTAVDNHKVGVSLYGIKWAISDFMQETPQQSLAEIQAKAINDAVECCITKLQYNDGTYKVQIHVNDLEDYASELLIKASK